MNATSVVMFFGAVGIAAITGYYVGAIREMNRMRHKLDPNLDRRTFKRRRVYPPTWATQYDSVERRSHEERRA